MVVGRTTIAGTPACTTGAMYYDEGINKFRICVSAQWRNITMDELPPVPGEWFRDVPGSDMFAVPERVTSIHVTLCSGGGGGGGGSGGYGGGTNFYNGGAGGGAGGNRVCNSAVPVTVTPFQIYTVTIGAGGSGGQGGAGRYDYNCGYSGAVGGVGGSSVFSGIPASPQTPGGNGGTCSSSLYTTSPIPIYKIIMAGGSGASPGGGNGTANIAYLPTTVSMSGKAGGSVVPDQTYPVGYGPVNGSAGTSATCPSGCAPGNGGNGGKGGAGKVTITWP